MKKRYIVIILLIICIIFSFYIFSGNYTKVNTDIDKSYLNDEATKNSLSGLLSEILNFLVDDYEIVTNSAISCDIKLDSLYDTDDYEKLKNILGPSLSHYTATPYIMKLSLYDVRNIKTNETEKYLIAFYNQTDEGIVIISQRILKNNAEIEEIKNQITKRN